MKTIAFFLIGLLALSTQAFPQTNSLKSNKMITKTPSPMTTAHVSANTTETQALKVVQEFLTAVQQGDHAKLGTLLHPDVTWQQPGNNRFSGTKRSSGEVFQMVGGMMEYSATTLRLSDIKSLTVNGNQVACLLHWKAAQPVGTLLAVDNIDVYTVENGQIVHVTVYSQDPAQEDVFWGK